MITQQLMSGLIIDFAQCITIYTSALTIGNLTQ